MPLTLGLDLTLAVMLTLIQGTGAARPARVRGLALSVALIPLLTWTLIEEQQYCDSNRDVEDPAPNEPDPNRYQS